MVDDGERGVGWIERQVAGNQGVVGGGGNNLSSSTVRLNKEFHNFCLKFESLCNSPRLSKPAWLTIVQNNNIDNDVNKSKQQTCNKLINDFVYLYDHLNKKDL